MSDKINAFFQLLEGRFGLLPTSVATIALVIVLVLALLLLYSLLKLRSARQVIHQFGERLGYDPPYGDGVEILHEEIGKDILLRGREIKIKQLEERVAYLETEGNTKDANITVLQQRAKELEGQLQQASFQNDKSLALANEQLQTHRTSIDRLEQRIRDMDAEGTASLTGLQRRTKELEGQLQQASNQNERFTSQAREQEQSYRTAVEQLEQRMRQMEAEGSAYLSSVEQRAKELEEQLQRATVQHEEILAQAGELERAHQTAVEHFEGRTREMEAESIANLTTLRQRFNELEDQLQQASLKNDELSTQAGEQANAHQSAVERLEHRIRELEAGNSADLDGLHQHARELEEQLQHASFRNVELLAQAGEQANAHQSAVEQLEQRIREMEAGNNANLDGLQQRARELEEQLQHASVRNEELTAQAGVQAQAHQSAVEQLEQRIREIEAGHNGNLDGLHQRARELEEQLQHASARNEELTAQAGEQAQAHQSTVEYLEQRIREMEGGSDATLAALHQHSRELEEQLQQAMTRIENEKSSALQGALERNAETERLELRIRDLEAEKGIEESRAGTLELQIKELEDQLRQAADRATLEIADSSKMEVANGVVSVTISEALLRRAEWITGCAIGAILPHGLVAAESYASAALAANPQDIDAPQLLAELGRIRRAYPEGLPPVIESVTTFDERAAAFFAADLVRAADIADDEAQRRYRAGLNRSALLVVNMAIELRQQTGAEDSPDMLRLQEMKASLLVRLGNNAKTSNAAPKVAS